MQPLPLSLSPIPGGLQQERLHPPSPIFDIWHFDITMCAPDQFAHNCAQVFDFGLQSQLPPTPSPLQNIADSLCIVHHPPFCLQVLFDLPNDLHAIALDFCIQTSSPSIHTPLPILGRCRLLSASFITHLFNPANLTTPEQHPALPSHHPSLLTHWV